MPAPFEVIATCCLALSASFLLSCYGFFGATRLGDMSNDMCAGASHLFVGIRELGEGARHLCAPHSRLGAQQFTSTRARHVSSSLVRLTSAPVQLFSASCRLSSPS